MTIRLKVTISVLFAATLVAGVFEFFNYYQQRHDYIQRRQESYDRIVKRMSVTLPQLINDYYTTEVGQVVDSELNNREVSAIFILDTSKKIIVARGKKSTGELIDLSQLPAVKPTRWSNIIYFTKDSAQTLGAMAIYGEDKFFHHDLTVLKLMALAHVVFLDIILIVIIWFVLRQLISIPLNSITKVLDNSSNQALSTAQQVAAYSQQLSQGATEQASSMEETSSALEQMESMINQNVENASKASQMAMDTEAHAQKGDVSMKKMQTSMKAISDSALKAGNIVKTIEEVAFQTNILALNAAVEAARAGEHGKGFAVVADEVRNLALRASLAAKDTQLLIEDSQTRTKEGVEDTQKTSETLGSIIDAAKKVVDMINKIALASKEQAEGINQVTKAIAQMDQVTQQNASSAETSSAASTELALQAEDLKRMVLRLQQIIGTEGV